MLAQFPPRVPVKPAGLMLFLAGETSTPRIMAVAFCRVSCIFRLQGLDYQGRPPEALPRNHFKFQRLDLDEAFMITAWECFHFATLELVRSTPIKQRLICAYRRHLAEIPTEQLPIDIRETFAQIVRILCGVQPLRGEDAVAASVRKMSNQEADDCAAQIVELFGRMSRVHASGTRNTLLKLHSVAVSEADVGPESDQALPALIANH
jgi:hypothetical protein